MSKLTEVEKTLKNALETLILFHEYNDASIRWMQDHARQIEDLLTKIKSSK